MPAAVPGILTNRFGRLRLREDARGRLDGAGSVVDEQRRNFHGDPAVDSVGGREDRPQQVGRAAQVFERQIDEQCFVGLRAARGIADGAVVGRAAADGFVEDRGVGSEAGDRPFIDVASQRAAVEQVARDVVEPQALAEVAQLSRVHGSYSRDQLGVIARADFGGVGFVGVQVQLQREVAARCAR